MPDKGGFPHFMLKEIFEQPKALEETIAPRVSPETGQVKLADEVRIGSDELRSIRRVNIVASGTSRHAGIAGQFMFQELAHLPVDVDYASEFEYRNPMISRGEITIVITQSGETATPRQPSVRRRRKARAPSRSPTSKARPSRGRPMASSILTPGQRSASRPPKHSRLRWRCCFFSPNIWLKFAARFRRASSEAGSQNFWRCRRRRKLFSSKRPSASNWPIASTNSKVSFFADAQSIIPLRWMVR